MMMMTMMIIIIMEAKGSTSDPDSNIIYRSNSKVTIAKSNNTQPAPQYIYTAEKSVILGKCSIVRNFLNSK